MKCQSISIWHPGWIDFKSHATTGSIANSITQYRNTLVQVRVSVTFFQLYFSLISCGYLIGCLWQRPTLPLISLLLLCLLHLTSSYKAAAHSLCSCMLHTQQTHSILTGNSPTHTNLHSHGNCGCFQSVFVPQLWTFVINREALLI